MIIAATVDDQRGQFHITWGRDTLLALHRRLSRAEALVWDALVCYVWRGPGRGRVGRARTLIYERECLLVNHLTRKELAVATGLGEGTVKEALATLRAMGWIETLQSPIEPRQTMQVLGRRGDTLRGMDYTLLAQSDLNTWTLEYAKGWKARHRRTRAKASGERRLRGGRPTRVETAGSAPRPPRRPTASSPPAEEEASSSLSGLTSHDPGGCAPLPVAAESRSRTASARRSGVPNNKSTPYGVESTPAESDVPVPPPGVDEDLERPRESLMDRTRRALSARGIDTEVSGVATPRIGRVATPKLVEAREKRDLNRVEARRRRDEGVVEVKQVNAVTLGGWWRTRFASAFSCEPEMVPFSGRDLGHCKALVQEMGDQSKTVLEFAITNWDKIRSTYWRLRDIGFPDIQSVFLIRRELNMIVLTGKWPEPVASKKAPNRLTSHRKDYKWED